MASKYVGRDRPLILIVDDEEDLLDLVQYNLNKENFDTVLASDGIEGLEKAKKVVPDLIVLDIMMPRMDGIETCRHLREHAVLRTIPILMLTAKSEEADHVSGLESGADIYLTKPISIPVFVSQVKALLRGATRFDTPTNVLVLGTLKIDRDRYEVIRGTEKQSIRLARKEFDLLYFLATHPGKVFSRQDLLDRVWGLDVYVVDRTVDVHVRKIREKVGEQYIETIKGVGYRMPDWGA